MDDIARAVGYLAGWFGGGWLVHLPLVSYLPDKQAWGVGLFAVLIGWNLLPRRENTHG